jgi:CheY-like chemotaxis protein
MTLGSAGPGSVIVVADRDAEIRDAVASFMSARGYEVEPAADAETAAALLRSRKVDVLISDLALRGGDGVDLLTLARTTTPTTRRIAIASNASARDRDAALKLGAVRVLAKPLSLLELADAVRLAHDCAEGFHGWMHRMSLIDVLQMYHHSAQSLVVHVRGDVEGAIALRHGELIHADCRGLIGMPALIQLLAAQRGQLETEMLEPVIRTINGPFDHVLLDGLRSIDEIQNPSSGPALATVSFDGWLDEMTEPRDPLDREALVAWLAEHAPGAGVWRIEPGAPSIERLDALGAHPETEMAGTPGSLGWAYELAELTDPEWTRIELTSGATAIALLRVPGVMLAFARLVTGDAVKRRFHVESAQLVRWLNEHVGQAG